jgi:uncharacterized membrane protein
MSIELLVLRLIHVLCGIFWVGSALFTGLFLFPALATPGVQSGPVFGALRQRGLMTALPIAALLTIGSGIRLMALASAAFSGAWFTTLPGRTYAAAGFAAIIAFLISLTVARPAGIKAARLAASIADAPAEQRAALGAQAASLRQRSAVASAIVLALLIFAAAGMSVARYLR